MVNDTWYGDFRPRLHVAYVIMASSEVDGVTFVVSLNYSCDSYLSVTWSIKVDDSRAECEADLFQFPENT